MVNNYYMNEGEKQEPCWNISTVNANTYMSAFFLD